MTTWLAVCPTCRIPRYGIAFEGDEGGPRNPSQHPIADRALCCRCGLLIPLSGGHGRFTREI